MKFRDDVTPSKRVNIVDLAVAATSMIALTDEKKVYVWGQRMGIYPRCELTLDFVEACGALLEKNEINQVCPRLVKNNLIFYKVSKVFAGYFNVGLVSSDGEVLVHGANNHGQLLLPIEIQENLSFFPEFKKLDFFQTYLVQDIKFSMNVTYVLCRHKQTGQTHLFGWGSNKFGQLANLNLLMMQFEEPLDLTAKFITELGEEITQITLGATHVLVLTSKNKLWAFGDNTMGQLGQLTKSHTVTNPVEVQAAVTSIASGW